MRPFLSTLLAIAVLALAGCATTGAQAPLAPAAAAVTPTQVTPLDLTGCAYIESVNTVPGALVDPLIPDDFRVAGTANLVVGMAQCDATTAAGDTDRVTFGWADVSVYPPSALRAPNGGLHLYRIEHLAMDDLYGQLHAAMGAECRVLEDASVVVDLLEVHAATSDAGASAWDIRVPVGPAGDGAGGETRYREFGPAQGGYAYLDGVLVDPGARVLPGTFLVDAQSPLFGVWGPAWASPIQFAQGFGIVDAEIGFLPWESAAAPAATC